MKYLAICIPNYNRPDKLERLLLETAGQIINNRLENLVEICISDDYSDEDPVGLVREVQMKFPNVSIQYKRNAANMGMDHNFLNSVLLSDSLYCWIIGNDDLPAKNGLKLVVDKLTEKNNAVDLLVTPFDIVNSNGDKINTVYPLNLSTDIETEFHTEKEEDHVSLLKKVQHNSGLFGFLSNVVFKRENWNKYQNSFKNKMNTIFIQIYMNVQLLEDGAFYLYSPQKIINNGSDETVNESLKRICDILLGLDGVLEYFYHGEILQELKRVIVDAYISGLVWDLPDNNEYKKKIKQLNSEKNNIYKKFFLSSDERAQSLENKNIILFGAGNYGRKAFDILNECRADVVAVIDSDKEKHGKNFGSYKIQPVEAMDSLYQSKQAYIVIANHNNLVEMIKMLLKKEFDRLIIIT